LSSASFLGREISLSLFFFLLIWMV
jgi:hypothetical protein